MNHKIRFSPSCRIGWNRLGPLVSGWFAPFIQSKHFGLVTKFWTDFENANSRSKLIGYMNFFWPIKKLDLTTPITSGKKFTFFRATVLKKEPKAMKELLSVMESVSARTSIFENRILVALQTLHSEKFFVGESVRFGKLAQNITVATLKCCSFRFCGSTGSGYCTVLKNVMSINTALLQQIQHWHDK